MPAPTVTADEIRASRVAQTPSRRRWLPITLAAIGCALAIAACGGSGTGTASTSGGQSGSLVSFAVCMRSHGVSSFPDPGGGSSQGGVSIAPTDIDTSAPAFRTAWTACRNLMPGLSAHHAPSEPALEQMRRFSECMRSHGVSGFPDPTATPPSGLGSGAPPPSSHSGYGAVVRRGGVYLAIPDTINPVSPTYRHAAAACRFGPRFS